MSQLNHGDALWFVVRFYLVYPIRMHTTRDPAPLHDFKRIQTGDVGYIRRGCFHLLFSAGFPLGERRLGVDVPRTFKQLVIGPVSNTQPRLPGYLSTNTVRKTRTPLRVSMIPDPYVRFVAPIPPEPQVCTPGCWNPVQSSRSGSEEIKAPPF